jgi:hypothetical protein
MACTAAMAALLRCMPWRETLGPVRPCYPDRGGSLAGHGYSMGLNSEATGCAVSPCRSRPPASIPPLFAWPQTSAAHQGNRRNAWFETMVTVPPIPSRKTPKRGSVPDAESVFFHRSSGSKADRRGSAAQESAMVSALSSCSRSIQLTLAAAPRRQRRRHGAGTKYPRQW